MPNLRTRRYRAAGKICGPASPKCPASGLTTGAAIKFQLALSVPEAVFFINGERIELGKQPAFRLGQMQGDGPGLATGGQEFADVVHMGARLVFGRKLLQR